MKNIFNKNLDKSVEKIIIEDESFHHFRNVLRGKKGDEVKLFNGKGLIATGIVSEMSKKSLTIDINNIKDTPRFQAPRLIIGIPKKEYLESIIRSAIQIGVSKLSLVTTEFTPWKYKYYDRLEKIMEAALIQSENPYLPELEVFSSLTEVLSNKDQGQILAFSTEVSEGSNIADTKVESLLIGPEGGFSSDEVELLKNTTHVILMKCNIPIMKAEVAVPFGLGLLYKS